MPEFKDYFGKIKVKNWDDVYLTALTQIKKTLKEKIENWEKDYPKPEGKFFIEGFEFEIEVAD